MITPDQHLAEANGARAMYQQEIATFQRVITLRAIIVIVVALLIYAQFARVVRVNRDLDSFGPRSSQERKSTVASFLSTHLDDDDYTLTLSRESRTLLRILDGSDRILGKTTSVDLHYAQQIEDVLSAAKERPNQIRMTLPYFGDVALPIGYVVLAFVTALLSLGMNLFLLLRQVEIRSIYKYAETHLKAAVEPEAQFSFAPNFVESTSLSSIAIVDIATGVRWADVRKRRFTLLEFTTAMITVVGVISLLAMAWYLIFERVPIALGQSSLILAAGLVALLTAGVVAAIVQTIGRNVFASTNPF